MLSINFDIVRFSAAFCRLTVGWLSLTSAAATIMLVEKIVQFRGNKLCCQGAVTRKFVSGQSS